MENLIGLIVVFAFILVFNIIRKAAEALARQQAAARREAETTYKASPAQVREFIEQVRRATGDLTQELRTEPSPEQAAEPPPGVESEPEVLPAVEVAPLIEAEPAVRRAAAPLPALPQPEARPAPRRRRKRPAVAAAGRLPETTPSAPAAAGFDLRQAVIWSEILGPPLCLRRRVGHRPPMPLR